ncbi:hypothetical protein A2159_01075 [Candidatus Woesebacteria bacterium RBG_13_34_9]|uniref:Glutaredoxin domain-containing protein n=1 Tax=Candidatus Woesebacteria bacterium RBG_13_34_9 TaxID=1802477 RepID=A0A1F7X6K7_9BACT|nr:MAG: hypothetical protein A2159_01075 [Candidatus Woesebacteria bacterium RBG_13_34_9]
MKNFGFFVIVITILIVVGGVFISMAKSEKSSANNNPSIDEYFWSVTCPHCKNIADFMESWDKKDLYQVEKIEINSGSTSQQRFLQRGIFCKIAQKDLGVPLLVTAEGKCLQGDTSIIDYLKSLEI